MDFDFILLACLSSQLQRENKDADRNKETSNGGRKVELGSWREIVIWNWDNFNAYKKPFEETSTSPRSVKD